ncbi:neuron navigator 2 isoform X3 [Lates japonicus]|uniref:Neuron navigator 2 isoform X3 n=1 Tax=Lates japonicus TaxID=270547 RepID=A0AAD3R5D9_LATJO|nr:neuron navigator 2 isoform X3 [Lates japonicus]
MTDGGLGLYTRRLNRLPDSMAAVRETLHRNTSSGQGDADSWDDSSSVSSGISDNIDTDDINTSSSISSYANTPAAHGPLVHTHYLAHPNQHLRLKKQCGMVTIVTASGATITSGSATLGRAKSGRPPAGGLCWWTDGGLQHCHHDDVLPPRVLARSLQYRSLPSISSRQGRCDARKPPLPAASASPPRFCCHISWQNSISIAKANGSGALLANHGSGEGRSEIGQLEEWSCDAE